MDKKPRRNRGGTRSSGAQPHDGTAGGDSTFDKWLEDKLKTAYSSVLDEPIPEDLIKLLHQKLKG